MEAFVGCVLIVIILLVLSYGLDSKLNEIKEGLDNITKALNNLNKEEGE